MIVVTGANGNLGRQVVNLLKDRIPVSGIAVSVKEPEKAADLSAVGIDVRQADFRDRTSVVRAFTGAEKVTEVAGMVGTAMYVKIQELKRKGYKKQRVARELGIDTKTVQKYWEMSEAEYSTYLLETKEGSKIMDPYRDFVLEQLWKHPEITSAIIYDHLLEGFRGFAPSYRTVRLYVCNLRDAEGIPAPGKIRQYCEVEELPPGRQGQVDMGQQTMQDAYGKNQQTAGFNKMHLHLKFQKVGCTLPDVQ